MASFPDYANLLGGGPSYLGGLAGAQTAGTAGMATTNGLNQLYQSQMEHMLRQRQYESMSSKWIQTWDIKEKQKKKTESKPQSFREELQAEVSAWLQ